MSRDHFYPIKGLGFHRSVNLRWQWTHSNFTSALILLGLKALNALKAQAQLAVVMTFGCLFFRDWGPSSGAPKQAEEPEQGRRSEGERTRRLERRRRLWRRHLHRNEEQVRRLPHFAGLRWSWCKTSRVYFLAEGRNLVESWLVLLIWLAALGSILCATKNFSRDIAQIYWCTA